MEVGELYREQQAAVLNVDGEEIPRNRVTPHPDSEDATTGDQSVGYAPTGHLDHDALDLAYFLAPMADYIVAHKPGARNDHEPASVS